MSIAVMDATNAIKNACWDLGGKGKRIRLSDLRRLIDVTDEQLLIAQRQGVITLMSLTPAELASADEAAAVTLVSGIHRHICYLG